MKQVILGTAGHIDHGKTSLIRAATGIDTDRLKEEKLRGITIELGFASIDLPSGQHVGIVDVPGHEKFVKNMVAGATGIDIVAMVIAADEGVMPQTREHMEICTLLGIRHGFVALTKIDMVDEEWLELVIEDISDFLQGTFLEDAPIVPVSSTTGKGIPDFINTLESMVSHVPERSVAGLFRLPIDRVFTMKGFGTVITGTLISGRIGVGDTIIVYPPGITSKVRGIQVHNQSVEHADVGMRTAINFQGLEKSAVQRGDVLARPDTLVPSYMIDVQFNYLASNSKPIKNRTRVRFHTGTSEVLGVLVLLESEELLPGESTVAQIRLDAPVAIVKDDRFVIRSYSPVRTIGGGQVLNPIPKKHKRFKPEIIDGLKALTESGTDEIILHHASDAGAEGISHVQLKLMTNLPDKQLDGALGGLLSRRALIQIDKENRLYIHGESFEQLKAGATGFLKIYHKANPLRKGMSKEELKSKFPSVLSGKLFNLVLNQMIKEKAVVQDEDTVHLAEHKVSLGQDQAEVRKKILETYQTAGLQPPYFKELGKSLDIDTARARDVMNLLVKDGFIIKAKDDLFFGADAVRELKGRLVNYLETNGEITTPQFKEMAGCSRKYLIPLLEYFDATNVTIRVGDSRKLRRG